MPVLKKQFLSPILIAHPIFKGLCVSECVEGWRETGDVLAHSHVYPRDPFVGWICCKGLSAVADDQLLRHEMAHLLSSYNHGHDSTWRNKVIELGGSLAEYTFRLGRFQYDVPCFTKRCMEDDGAPAEERFPAGMETAEDEKYNRAIRLNPGILRERDELINKINKFPFLEGIQDGPAYLKEKLSKIVSYDQYQSLIDQVTFPLGASAYFR